MRVGRYCTENAPGLHIFTDDPDMERHVGKPWLSAWVQRWLENRYGPAPERKAALSGDAAVDDDLLRGHTFLCGASNSGKSRLAILMAREQLKADCSVVVIDIKDQTILHMMDTARRLSIPTDRVTLLMPSLGGLASWNPLDAAAQGVSAVEAVNEFIAVQEDVEGGELGVSVREVMRNALLLASAHRLSFYEVPAILGNEHYRESLLGLEPVANLMSVETYRQVVTYFRLDFGRLSTTKRQDAADPVNRRLREFWENDGARSILCSPSPSFRLTHLWERPQLLLVHLDTRTFGTHNARLLGTLLARQLFSAAMQAGGKGGNPVVLFLDEIGSSQKFLGDAPEESLAVMRSYDLRLMVACQFLSLVGGKLRDALVSTTSVRAFFRLGDADARLAAPSLAGDEDAEWPRIEVEADRTAVPVAWESPLLDAEGSHLFLYPQSYRELSSRLCAERARALENRLAFRRVPVPITAAGVPIQELLAHVPDWELTGPEPLGIRVRFPRPKLRTHKARSGDGGERGLVRKLQRLPKAACMLYLAGSDSAGLVRVENVPDCPRPATRKCAADPEYTDFSAYLSEVKSHGQSPAAASAALAERLARIEALSRAPEPSPPQTAPAGRAKSATMRTVAPVPPAEEDDSA